MEPGKLQRAPSDDAWCAVVGAEWNKICDLVEALQFEVASPLSLERDPAGGRLLSVNVPLQVMVLRLTDTETTGGFYKARTLYGSVDVPNVTTFTMPLGLTEQPVDDALVLFPPEAGTSAHSLSTSGSSAYGAGLFVGMTKEATPRKALVWFGGGSALPTPRPRWNPLQPINDDGDVAFTRPTFVTNP